MAALNASLILSFAASGCASDPIGALVTATREEEVVIVDWECRCFAVDYGYGSTRDCVDALTPSEDETSCVEAYFRRLETEIGYMSRADHDQTGESLVVAYLECLHQAAETARECTTLGCAEIDAWRACQVNRVNRCADLRAKLQPRAHAACADSDASAPSK